MSFCQLRLATERPKSVLKNGSSRIRVAGEQIHPIAERRYVVRALSRSPHCFAELAAVSCGSPK
jgi:hypothetical protein